jgi:hypothetical protein
VLRLRGVICLHASAVNINDRSVIFVGSEGAGKSTMAAAFARQGFFVLSDDIVALSEYGREFRALPACPRVNLWPDSVEILYGSREALPRITAGWECWGEVRTTSTAIWSYLRSWGWDGRR